MVCIPYNHKQYSEYNSTRTRHFYVVVCAARASNALVLAVGKAVARTHVKLRLRCVSVASGLEVKQNERYVGVNAGIYSKQNVYSFDLLMNVTTPLYACSDRSMSGP